MALSKNPGSSILGVWNNPTSSLTSIDITVYLDMDPDCVRKDWSLPYVFHTMFLSFSMAQ
jgi:hypothetical protein